MLYNTYYSINYWKEVKNMMGYYGAGGWAGGGLMMLFGSIAYILIVVLLCLAIAALWKYLNDKK